MGLEIYFTIKGEEKERQFSITSGSTQEELFLYTPNGDNIIKYSLQNNAGLLTLTVDNPFSEEDEVVNEKLMGLSSDYLEQMNQGMESDIDFELEHSNPGYGPDDIYVENKPFSLKQISDLIELGDIEMTPDFQRNFVWDRTRQSRLIESVLLGLPLPSIYLSQYEDGRLTVVDGLQRLHTIKFFMDNQLELTNLEYLTNCNGHTHNSLEGILSPLRLRRFGQTQIMCFVIDYRSPTQLKFDLFRRLNTGGKPLNNQEIRNCLSRPHVQRLLKDMVELESFKLATDYSVGDRRMEARESALRYLYFHEDFSKPKLNYSGDMESTLDQFIDDLNKRELNDSKIKEIILRYENSLQIAHYLFGRYAFRKINTGTFEGRRAPVNKLLMMVNSVILSRYDFEKVKDKCQQDSLALPLALLIESDPELFNVLTWSTNSRHNVDVVYDRLHRFFEIEIGA